VSLVTRIERKPTANVQGADLSSFQWADADLTDATFTDCVVENVQLSNTILTGAKFLRCNIVGCRMAHVDARETIFEDCTLTDHEAHAGISVTFSQFEQSRFIRCDISFAKFERSDFYDVYLEDCNLRAARFDRIDFSKSFGRNIVRTSGILRRCNFHLAEMSNLNLQACDLSGSHFLEADLSGTNLEGANLRDCTLFGTILTGAKLANADLRGAEISGLNLGDLESRAGMKITRDQQHLLLTALGVDVCLD
jgi:fluoroquinolone resistance protein